MNNSLCIADNAWTFDITKNKLFEVYYKKFSTMTVFFDNTFSYGNTYNDIKERFKSSLKRENFNSC